MVPPIDLSQCYRAIEQLAEVGFCDDGAFLPILKYISLLKEYDSFYFRRDLVDVVRHQQQGFPLLHMFPHQVQVVKRRRQIESARRFIKHERCRIVHLRAAEEASPLLAGRHRSKPSILQQASTHLFQHIVCPSELRIAEILMAINSNAGIKT